MHLLNIPVSPAHSARWRGYLAPPRQPFFLTPEEATGYATDARAGLALTPEERDTYTLWAVNEAAERVLWLTRAEFDALPPAQQRRLLRLQVRHGRGNVPLGRHFGDLLPELPAGRFLWTPELLTPAVLARIVSKDQKVCQREAVPESVWRAAQARLPRVRELAGTFPTGSAGNCFGAVMGAAGVPEAENAWMQHEPFEQFLRERTTEGGSDDQPGTLLLWRSADGLAVGGLAQHAAVTLGGGWAFEKASQTWITPRTVQPVRALIAGNRTAGWRLSRHTLG